MGVNIEKIKEEEQIEESITKTTGGNLLQRHKINLKKIKREEIKKGRENVLQKKDEYEQTKIKEK